MLTVGQDVRINGGFGPVDGRVVEISPPCIYVETANGRFRFNLDGKECSPDGKACTYERNIMVGPGPWELSLDGTSPPVSKYYEWRQTPVDRTRPG